MSEAPAAPTRPLSGGDAVARRLGELGAELRTHGTRVGIGELLSAHRALAAIDSFSREQARLALRTVLCSQHIDLERFDLAFTSVFGDGVPGRDAWPAELGAIERAPLPATGIPDPAGAGAEAGRTHGRRLGRGAVVVVLSDGWDRGDPAQLEQEMARLRRAAHRLVWLNPLAAHPGYEPLTRGMRAAVPHPDQLLAGNSLASLERLADVLEEM